MKLKIHFNWLMNYVTVRLHICFSFLIYLQKEKKKNNLIHKPLPPTVSLFDVSEVDVWLLQCFKSFMPRFKEAVIPKHI